MLFDNPALRELKQQFNDVKERKEGMVRASDRGFGFLDTPDRNSYFIPPQAMRQLLHGDRISALIEQDDRGREVAKPEKLIEAGLSRFVARVVFSGGKLCVAPDVPQITTRISADDKREDSSVKLGNGDFVICRLTAHALKRRQFHAEITEFVAARDNPRIPWLVTLRGLDLPLECPRAQTLPEFFEADCPREDLRDIPFVTIDSAKTEDMDDAIYLESHDDHFLLHVAIADPTGYIREGSEFDAEAARRAFSIYLPGTDIPILPRELSDNLCSLRPNEDRPVLAATIRVLRDGTIDFAATRFCLATIRSHGKLVYNEVSDFLEGKETTFVPDAGIAQLLRDFQEFAKIRDAYRAAHAAPFRDHPDYEFVLNEAGGLDHIEANYRRAANRIIEEAMITANLACGEYLAEKFGAGIFNTHRGFDHKAEKEVLELLTEEGYPEPTTDKIYDIEGFSEIRRFANAKPDPYMDCRIRKLQEYSQMSTTPAPHFALGANRYATWTSPIRKYGDMVNHRLIKSVLTGAPAPKLPAEKQITLMNLARKYNRQAERNCEDWLYADLLAPEIDKQTVFSGEVFDLTRGGVKLILDDNGAMIFIPSSFLSADRDVLSIDGIRGKASVGGQVVLKLGDHMQARIFEVNRQTRSITGFPAEPLPGVRLPDPDKLHARH